MASVSASNPLAYHGKTIRQLASFGAIGVASTVSYVALFALLRVATSAGIANALALVTTALGNTAANRWLTFGVRGRDGLARDHAAGLLAFGAAFLLTSASLLILGAIKPNHSRTAEIAVLVLANGVATLLRFALLRLVMKPRSGAPRAVSPPAGAHVQAEAT